MITFLSSPKPFKGKAKEQQYNAIMSWQGASSNVQVILYGDSEGIDQAGSELGVQVIKNIACAPSGIPYFSSIVAHAQEHARYDFQVYINGDILLSGILPTLACIAFPRFLLIGQRIDLSENVFVNLMDSDWIFQLAQVVRQGKAKLHSPSGTDYFAFRRGLWQNVPPIIIGRAGYDNALLAYCMRQNVPIVDGTFSVTALHQFHDYNHVQGGHKFVMNGPEAKHNYSFAGGKRSSLHVSDAGYLVKNGVVMEWPCRGDRLRRFELELRHVAGWSKTALLLRALWRGLELLAVIHEYPLSIDEVLGVLQS